VICIFAVAWQCTSIAHAQVLKKTANWVLHHALIDTTTPGQPSFRIYPTLAYAPETDLEIGISTLYIFQAKKDSNNRISELNAFTFFTLQKQYGIWLDNAIYGDKDKWFILGRTRFQRFPLLYYGVGPNAVKDYPATIDANYLLFRQRVLRKIAPNLFLGPEVDYQSLSRTSVEHHKNDVVKELPAGSEGSSNIGLGGAIVYDNRHNVLNVRKGHFAEIGLLNYSRKLGSKYDFNGINTDFRTYQPISKRDVLALQVTGNFYTGNVPFNQMALMGGEIMMRGYYYGRYRDKNMIAAQAEYRMLPLSFSKRIGAAFFAGTAVVAPTIGSLRLDNLKLAGGAGIRYLLFPKKDIFVRFDVGVTKEGVGFYFFTGEAF
jgi:outer membrane protein assembly factor BamA